MDVFGRNKVHGYTKGEKLVKLEKSYIQLGNKIKELRKKRNLTQTSLSQQLGVTSTYVSLIEQGKRGGADEFLLKVEKFFKLKPKTLLNLRDIQVSESLQEQELEHKPITNHSPDYIQLLVDALLSCGEDYVNQKVPNWLKELQDDLYNRLTPYELDEVKKHVIAVKRSWVVETKTSDVSEKDSNIIQGCIVEDEKKHFFSLQENRYSLTLNLQHGDVQQAQYFESWLGHGVLGIQYRNNYLI